MSAPPWQGWQQWHLAVQRRQGLAAPLRPGRSLSSQPGTSPPSSGPMAAVPLPPRSKPLQRQQQQQQQQRGQRQPQEQAAPVGVCRRKALPMGWKKLEFVLPLARRRSVDDALAQLAACPKRAAVAVRNAVANARNNAIAQGANPASLVVERVWTGRATPFEKPWFHGRGYHSVRQRRRTHLTVIVQEAAQLAGSALVPAKLVRPAMLRPRRERRHPRPGQLPMAAAGSTSGGVAPSASTAA